MNTSTHRPERPPEPDPQAPAPGVRPMAAQAAAPAAAGRGPAGTSGGAPAADEPRRVSSRTLFAGQREVVIEHEGALYRLRLTSQGKLILTK